MKMVKNEMFAFCAVYKSIYLPGSTKALQFFPLDIDIPFPPNSSPTHSRQGSGGKKGFILCEQNCVELNGNLPLATILRGHMGKNIGIYLLIETWERTRWMGVVL